MLPSERQESMSASSKANSIALMAVRIFLNRVIMVFNLVHPLV